MATDTTSHPSARSRPRHLLQQWGVLLHRIVARDGLLLMAGAGDSTAGVAVAPGTSSDERHPEGGARTADDIRAEAERLFLRLPEEIRDPASRSVEGTTAMWSAISPRPSAHDLLALTDEQFETYERVVELTEQWLELDRGA